MDAPEPGEPEAGTVGGSSRAQAAVSLLLRYGLWGALVLALVLGVVNVVAPFRTAAPAPVSAAAEPSPVPPPGGCAELVVAAWLAGDADLLAGVAGMPRDDPEPGRRRAVHTYTAGVTPAEQASVGDGPAWGYLVGAEVEVRAEDQDQDEDGPWQAAGLQFFAVTLVRVPQGCQGWAPATLPAQVAGPALTSPASSYPVSLPVSGTELGGTLEAFFAGMLTGEGNPERFVAPGAVVAFPSPPPYQEVSVTDLHARQEAPVERDAGVPADGTVVPLLATVAVDEDGLPLVYPVTVGVRGGRWEVVALDPLLGG